MPCFVDFLGHVSSSSVPNTLATPLTPTQEPALIGLRPNGSAVPPAAPRPAAEGAAGIGSPRLPLLTARVLTVRELVTINTDHTHAVKGKFSLSLRNNGT